jgi:hypothetical protein
VIRQIAGGGGAGGGVEKLRKHETLTGVKDVNPVTTEGHHQKFTRKNSNDRRKLTRGLTFNQ